MFSIKIKALRENAGYSTQQEFAKAFGVKQSAVGNWEAGSRIPTIETLKRLSQFFCVSIDYLLDLTDDPTAKGGLFAAYIRKQRGSEPPELFAARCGISVDLLQKIECGLCRSHPNTVSIKYTCLSSDQIKSIANGIGIADWRYIECLYYGYNPHNVEYHQPCPDFLRFPDDLPEKVIIPDDDHTKGLPIRLPSNSSGVYLSDDEEQLLIAYRKADANIKAGITQILGVDSNIVSSAPPAQEKRTG